MKTIKIIFLLLTFNIFAQTENSRLDDLRKLTKIDSTDKPVYILLDDFYAQALQSDLGELKENIPEKIEKLVGNKRTKNRHLLLMFFAYQVHIQQTLAVGKNQIQSFKQK